MGKAQQRQKNRTMVTNSNRVLPLAILAAVFLLGGVISWYFFAPKSKPTEEAQVMLERIRTVMKLVTVEGQYSELFTHNDYDGAFTFFWEKKMLIRVTATVSAGYDLEKVSINADATTKTIRLNGLPKATILSIDDKVDYYDISEGIFTSFSPQDYNRINERIEDIIREKAQASLLSSAEAQGQKTLDMLRAMVESAGWTMEIEGSKSDALLH
jgi:hypothetical protein